MGDLFPIPLFPDYLQGSVLIPIFVGVLVMTLLNERFGWTFSGIVVPGYLVPIIVVAPWSAAVISLEALLTIVIVQILTVTAFRKGLWPPLFGRDKFFFILLVSVAVRLAMERWLLPILGEQLRAYDPYFDYHNRFKAIGLVVVPLMANMVWKAGVARGFVHVGVTTGLTAAIVMFIVTPLTDYSIGHSYYIYEVVALQFSQSIPAYIIILFGAFLASRANLYLGWDFSGIMVPTLLALALIYPMRFMVTILEAVVIVLVCRQVLRLPGLRSGTWEGPRLVCLMYGIGLVLKTATGHISSSVVPGFAYESLFGYGYLLSTLMAMKMYQKDMFVMVSMPVVGVSLGIQIAASLFMQSLSRVDQDIIKQLSEEGVQAVHQDMHVSKASAFELMQQERSRILRSWREQPYIPPTVSEAQQYKALLQMVSDLSRGIKRTDPPVEWSTIQQAALALGLEVVALQKPSEDAVQHYLLVREPVEVPGAARRRGWGSALFRVGSSQDSVLLVPRPLQEAGAVEAGTVLMKSFDAHLLLIPGAHARASRDGESDVLRQMNVPFQLAASCFSHYTAVEVRLIDDPAQRQLWVASHLPASVPVQVLLNDIPDFPITFPPQRSPVDNGLLRRVRRPAYLSLALHEDDVKTLLFAQYKRDNPQAGDAVSALKVERQSLRSQLTTIIDAEMSGLPDVDARAGMDRLVVWEQAILQPLTQLVTNNAMQAHKHMEEVLAPLLDLVAAQGYELRFLEDLHGDRFLILSAKHDQAAGQGLFVFRLGPARPYQLLVPLPMTLPGTAEAGLHLFLLTDARSLAIGPLGKTAPGAIRPDRRWRQDKQTLYHLIFQSVQRSSWGEKPLIPIEILGAEVLPGVQGLGCIVKQANLLGGRLGLQEELREFTSLLQDCQLDVRIHDGAADVSGLSLHGNPQYAFTHANQPGMHAALWFDRETRRHLQRTMPAAGRVQAIRSLATGFKEGVLLKRVLSLQKTLPTVEVDKDILVVWQRLHRHLQAYGQDKNLLRLEQVLQDAERNGMHHELFHDHDSDSLHLIVGFVHAERTHGQMAVCNVHALSNAAQTDATQSIDSLLHDFLRYRRALLDLRWSGDQ